MIPVSLRLKNFMSYGTAAAVLDFEQFQVACLSGRNGQGKSALLDAITWSLWGEARKSSGSHKPDDELIRIGEREMQVEFVFDIEGERYRVVRSYTRSATGKTSRPDLELHVLETNGDDYRPLTGGSIRETQEHIDRAIGLDYNTFINSAFLLQGRSDEFTKKRPSERKDILTRILNLLRYEDLYALASEQERAARKGIEQAERDLERLTEALGDVPTWEAEHAEVEAAIAAQRITLEALRADERALAEQRAGLEARAREAQGIRQSIETLQARKAEHDRDGEALRGKIAEAEALIAQRDDIQRDHERHLALQAERDELDQKNELFRGLEKQIERVERELQEQKSDLERQLDKLRVEERSIQTQLAEHETQLAEEPSLRRRLVAGQAAKRRAEALHAIYLQRRELEQERDVLERAINRQREELAARRTALEEQIARERQKQPDFDHLRKQVEELEQQAATRTAHQQELDETRQQGQAVGEDLNRLTGSLSPRQEELATLDERDARLDVQDGVCPTCGTELTDNHRAEVRARLRQQRDRLRQAIRQLEAQIEDRKQSRDALRQRYRELQGRLKDLDDVPEVLVRLKEQMRRAEESKQALATLEKEASDLRQTIDDKAFAKDERCRFEKLGRELAALEFDEESYEKVRQEAAQVEHLESRLLHLEAVAGRKVEMERKLETTKASATTIRQQLDDGSVFASKREHIQRFRTQIDQLGFDSGRFHGVKRELEELKEAGKRMTDLVNAQLNQADWQTQLEAVASRTARVCREIDAQREKLATLEAELEGRAEVEAQQQAKAAECRAAEAALHALQVQLGQLSEKLDQAQRDRDALKQCRAAANEAEKKRALFKHLKAAFSKHGIPSLIIEQTLPEIEDRANDLLERLTDGRMHVRLETLKDKKTGGTKETLEIRITDEQGASRPYETFSGGEAFRVNFALRIALAQLLAERNGVRVRTLVVDEGFGTQDQQGIQNLVEAIQIIQDDFDKILVITHLPELKEVFPVRIEVEKDPVEGSRFEVMGV